MKTKLILLFITSWLGSMCLVFGQDSTLVATDTIKAPLSTYGIRVGGDVSKLARTALEDGYTGFELNGDIRVYKRFYAAVEIGAEERVWDEADLVATANGSYAKVGFDFNAYKNWLGMENAIFAGLRYGFATFSQELNQYPVYTTNPTFPTEIRTENIEYSGLNASWAEFIFGVKTEIWNNLYLSINLQLKRMISEKQPDNFDNLIIPGFNRTYDFSEFGVGYGYTLSYLIPILKR